MKDYKEIGRKLSKIALLSEISQCGTPTKYFPVDLKIQIREPYIIGYDFYVAYNASAKTWVIDYSFDSPFICRAEMQHIRDIKTDKEMYENVSYIIKESRKKFQLSGYAYLRMTVEEQYYSLVEKKDFPELTGEDAECMSFEFLSSFIGDLLADEVVTEKQVEELAEIAANNTKPLKIIYSEMIIFCLRKEYPMVVKSNNIYSPQSYLETVTGNCYFFNTSKPILEQITDILKEHNKPTENYLLSETEKVLTNNKPVVLVNCCDVDDSNTTPIAEYRWFRVPENFKE